MSIVEAKALIGISFACLIYIVLCGICIAACGKRRLLLLASLLVSLVVMSVYWAAAIVKDSAPLVVLPVPILIIFSLGIPWVGFAHVTLNVAERWRHEHLRGPATEVAAMLVITLPTILVASLVPTAVELEPLWTAVSLLLVGVTLSAVIAKPMRQLLIRGSGLDS